MRTALYMAVVSLGSYAHASTPQAPFLEPEPSPQWCPQPQYTAPSPETAYYETAAFANLSLTRMFGAIAHPTVAYDDFGEPEPVDPRDRDPRWDTFPPFHEYLRETYPLV